MSHDLTLDNQLCFSIYATSRMITRAYKPFLDKLGITYPQYLVLIVLWEEQQLPVNTIAKRLHLNTNTITPLLKRMADMELLERKPCELDERKINVHLTSKGAKMKTEAISVRDGMMQCLGKCDQLDKTEMLELKRRLDQLLETLS